MELKSETPWVRAFSNLDLDAVRLRLKWGPLRTQNATNGDVSGVTIEYAIDLQTDGGVWTEVLKPRFQIRLLQIMNALIVLICLELTQVGSYVFADLLRIQLQSMSATRCILQLLQK